MKKVENQLEDQNKIFGVKWIMAIIGATITAKIGALVVMVSLALIYFWTSSMPRTEAIIDSVIIIVIGLIGVAIFRWIYSAKS